MLGNLRSVAGDPLGFFSRLQAAHGNLVALRFPRFTSYLVSSPDLVRQVLQERQQNTRKGFEYELLKPLLGEGLVTSNGAFWKRQRRLAQPAFHRQRIEAFADLIVSRAGELAERFALRAGPRDVHAEMMGLTLGVVGEALFGIELTDDRERVGAALDRVLHFFSHRNRSLWSFVPLDWPLPSHRAFYRDRAVLEAMIDRIIATRRDAGNAGRSDLLAMLMEARDEEGAPGEAAMTDRQLRDECMTMVLAGHETTANLLSWTLRLLSEAPAIAHQLRDEIDGALRGAPPTVAELPKLVLLDRVIKEALRLYPPVWAISRFLIADDALDGYPIAANSQLLISQYVIHHRADLWPDPERFDPSRFEERHTQSRPRFAYFPFGGGPRQCIGNLFALLEAQLILVVLLQQTSIQIEVERPVELDPSITLRPRHGLPGTVGPRR